LIGFDGKKIDNFFVTKTLSRSIHFVNLNSMLLGFIYGPVKRWTKQTEKEID